MAWGSTTTDCDRRLKAENARLQAEAEERRYEDERRRDREEQEREEARRQRKAEYEESLQQANDWPDAFSKARILFGREAAGERQDNARATAHLEAHPEDKDDPCWQPQSYFIGIYEQLPKAQLIYHEEMQAVQAQIDALKAAAMTRMAERAESEIGESTISQAFRDNDPSLLTNW